MKISQILNLFSLKLRKPKIDTGTDTETENSSQSILGLIPELRKGRNRYRYWYQYQYQNKAFRYDTHTDSPVCLCSISSPEIWLHFWMTPNNSHTSILTTNLSFDIVLQKKLILLCSTLKNAHSVFWPIFETCVFFSMEGGFMWHIIGCKKASHLMLKVLS